MAVTITKKFHNETEYKDIAKIVFTSPNFTSPAVAGTRSHMPPGGVYMGTWFEAVDWMYRQFPNQDYADFPGQQESLLGKFTAIEKFDFSEGVTTTLFHQYGLNYDVVGDVDNVLYRDKTMYGIISSCVSGTTTIPGIGEVYTADVTLNGVVGSGIVNEWIDSTVTSNPSITVSGTAIGDTNPVTCYVSTTVTGTSDDSNNTFMTGTVSGSVTGIMYGTGTVVGTVTGDLSGRIDYSRNDGTGIIDYSDVTGTVSGEMTGAEHGAINGTVSGTLSGAMISPYEEMSFQYTSNSSITSATTEPRPRRHHGGNSLIFTVTFGEAYSCRLTAWDDATHSTTTNKILAEEHYRIDAIAFRSNIATPHAPVFNDTGLIVYPPKFDIPLKGNEKYYGDFDLIFAIDAGEYGEYLSFTPRLTNMDDSFTAGNYDFVTTLHYQYT